MREDVDIEARLAQRGEIGDGRLGARQDNEIGVARQRIARPHPHQLDGRLGVERIEIVEIGDMRQQRNGDLDGGSGLDRPRSLQREGILRRQQPRFGQEGDEAERLPAGGRRDKRHAVGEQRRVAAELVDQEAFDQRRVVGVDHRLGADQAGDHPAAVDVADQHHRHAGGAGEAHIGNVVGAQVDLRRAARAFDQNDVGFAFQSREAVQHEPHQLGLDRLVIGGAGASVDFALHHELGADLALRLEQHRVHMHGGRDARGAAPVTPGHGRSRRRPPSPLRCSTCSAA